MEFRWVSLIALWTLLSGPAFDSSNGPRPVSDRATATSRPAEVRRGTPANTLPHDLSARPTPRGARH